MFEKIKGLFKRNNNSKATNTEDSSKQRCNEANQITRPVWRDKDGKVACPGPSGCSFALGCEDGCPIFHNSEGLELLRNNKPLEAIAQFTKAVSIAPDFYEFHNNLAVAYGASGQHQKAYESFIKTLELKKDHPNAIHGLILSSANIGKFDEALQRCDEYEKVTGTSVQDLRDQIIMHTKGDSLNTILKKLAESADDYTIPDNGIIVNLAEFKTIQTLQYTCDSCGKAVEETIRLPFKQDEPILQYFRNIAYQFSKNGCSAMVKCYCNDCANKLYPGMKNGKNRIVFSVFREDLGQRIDSFPGEKEYRDLDYLIALEVVKGVDTIKRLSEVTKTRLDADGYLRVVHRVIGDAIDSEIDNLMNRQEHTENAPEPESKSAPEQEKESSYQGNFLVVANELLEEGRNAGYIVSDSLSFIPELLVQADTVCEKVYNEIYDYCENNPGANLISLTLTWAAIAGMGSVFFWDKDWNKLSADGIFETLTRARGLDEMDEYVLDTIGIGFSTSKGKEIVSFISGLSGYCMYRTVDGRTEFGLEDVLRAAKSMYTWGMVFEMNRLGMK